MKPGDLVYWNGIAYGYIMEVNIRYDFVAAEYREFYVNIYLEEGFEGLYFYSDENVLVTVSKLPEYLNNVFYPGWTGP